MRELTVSVFSLFFFWYNSSHNRFLQLFHLSIAARNERIMQRFCQATERSSYQREVDVFKGTRTQSD